MEYIKVEEKKRKISYAFSIRQDTDTGITKVARYNEADVGLGSSMPSQSSINCYFVIVVVFRMIVHESSHSPLKQK